jgi:hypothetical protein
MGMKPRLDDNPATYPGLVNQPKKIDEFSNEGAENLVTSLKTDKVFNTPNLITHTEKS